MQTNLYTLPEIDMVGGSTKEFYLQMVDEHGDPVSLLNASIDFSVCSFSNKTGVPLFSSTPTVEADDSGTTCLVKISINPEDTKLLFGKFVYQVTVVGDDKIGIPNQGLINIHKNINYGFIPTV